jgi:hypothetical protein
MNYRENEVVQTCNRVLIVSNGVVMQEAVAPAMIPPAAWTNMIFGTLGLTSSYLPPWSNNLSMQTVANCREY